MIDSPHSLAAGGTQARWLKSPFAFFVFAAAFLFAAMAGLYAVGGSEFRTFQADSDGLVIGSVEISRSEGIDFLAGFMRSQDTIHIKTATAIDPSRASDRYLPYLSQYGLIYKVAAFFAPRDAAALPSYFAKLRALFMLLTALVLALFAFRVRTEFGWVVGTIVTVELALSPWLLQFSKSVYWAPFLMLLPFAILFVWYGKCASPKQRALLFGAFGLALLVKFLSGYEYITCIAGGAVAAIVYHEMKHGGGWRAAVRPTVTAGAVAIVAFVVAAGFHYEQALRYFGTPYQALQAVLIPGQYNAGGRADISGDSITIHGLLSVAKIYFKQSALAFLSFGSVVTIGLLLTALYFFTQPRRARPPAAVAIWDNKVRALSVATAVAAAASFSWVLAVRHMLVHAHIDAIVFYLPFLPMLYVLTSAILVWSFGVRDTPD